MSIQAMRQALEALGCIDSALHVREINKVGEAMAALRQAIELEPKREWVGLTEKEAWECWVSQDHTKSWQNIEAKLKEKNCG